MPLRTLPSRTACKKALPAAGLLLGVALVTTACDPGTFVVSSGGKSATIAPESASPSSPVASRRPSAPASPAPTVTVTETPAPSDTATAVTADVSTCLPRALTEDYLRSLATSPQARADLAGCLQVPDAPGFEDQVALYAFQALESGEFRTYTGRQRWARADGDVRCPDGRHVHSLSQIYSQYN